MLKYNLGRPVLALLVTIFVTGGLAACASTERDTRYLHSQQRPPLQIPGGLDVPTYNPQMRVSAEASEDNSAAAQPVDSSFDIERPPLLNDTE